MDHRIIIRVFIPRMSLVEAVKIEEAIGKLVAKVEGARTELTAMTVRRPQEEAR